MQLNDKFTAEQGRFYLSGIQALVRLPLDQMRHDRSQGWNTAGFISGYEGSPLGGYDMALKRIEKILGEHRIHFVPGMNEDLAATAVMGSQMHRVAGGSKVDGVVGIWYGKGPGVDRSGDIFRHANLAGCEGRNAVLVLAGDDHISKSSTIPHQSDLSLYNVGIPVLYPGNAQEVLDYGLAAIALSRYSGAWVGMKLVTDVCDGGGTVDVDSRTPSFEFPSGYQKHNDPRLTIPFTLAMEVEVNSRRLSAARDFAYHNRLNRWHGAKERAWLGIATAGKSYYDVAQALRDLGISAEHLEELGIRVAKFGLTFPVERRFAADFARGLETVLVIEEKRSFLELQLRESFYNLPDRPRVIGKEDERGAPLLPPYGELDPDTIAGTIANLIFTRVPFGPAMERLEKLKALQSRPKELLELRAPNFCPGCPHNRSTLLPEGRVAGGGIGCHAMAGLLEDAGRGISFLTQMGAEGMPWIGMSPFVERQHIFQNIGDGTYFHSGQLAVEACIAAGVNITYKILYNGGVAMTGGQEAIGALPVPELTRKLQAEGVRKTIILAESPDNYSNPSVLASNAEVRSRDGLLNAMHELEGIPGVTVLIYDQQCAAEKRRQRSRGRLAEPTTRLVIHEQVCEDCGDCVKESNCMSLQPVETEFGRKMSIHQSSCNKDYTCALGNCPSFITVELEPGTGLRSRTLPALPAADVPSPTEVRPIGDDGYRILCPGIGGTGVITINALLATAALIDGLSVVSLDQTGAAQKGGAVVSHLVISKRPIEVAAKINAANADLILGFDPLGLANPENMKCAHPERTIAVLNTHLTPTSESIRKREVLAGPERILDLVNANTNRGRNILVDATRLAEGLFGSHLSVNIFLLGVAFQGGCVPVSVASLEQAIRLNGVDVDRNLHSFLWGRKYYHDAGWVEQFLGPKPAGSGPDVVAHRENELIAYQSRDYARQYREFIQRVEARAPALRDTVARSLYKLMAYKDEYEVARLLTKPDLEQQIREMWESVQSVGYNLHPPLLRALGMKRKLKLGAWFRFPLRILAAGKFLRDTPFDLFGYTGHRREERTLIVWYRELIEEVLSHSTPDNLALALKLAALPDEIRGYDEIKSESIRKVKKLAREGLATLKNSKGILTELTDAGSARPSYTV